MATLLNKNLKRKVRRKMADIEKCPTCDGEHINCEDVILEPDDSFSYLYYCVECQYEWKVSAETVTEK